jgi:hypothetical protein
MLRRRESSAASFFCREGEQKRPYVRKTKSGPGAPRRIVFYRSESNCLKVGQRWSAAIAAIGQFPLE